MYTLSRFTKDLKPQDINLNFLSGKGELNNLELDPKFLNEILQLPPWIEFQCAICDNIKAKVSGVVKVTHREHEITAEKCSNTCHHKMKFVLTLILPKMI